MTLQFEPVEINDSGEMVPNLPENTWIGQCKAQFGKTAAGDTKIAIEWTVTEDPSGNHEDCVGKVEYQTIVVRPTGHKYERMFLKDVYSIADKYELDRPRGWDGLVAFVKQLDGLRGEFSTYIDKAGESRVSYKAALPKADDLEDEKPAVKSKNGAAKKAANGKRR